MATRTIVTSQPDVACDVCGRRLLRGEQPDVFLAGGQRRTVCELCAPRASARGLAARGRAPFGEPAARSRRGVGATCSTGCARNARAPARARERTVRWRCRRLRSPATTSWTAPREEADTSARAGAQQRDRRARDAVRATTRRRCVEPPARPRRGQGRSGRWRCSTPASIPAAWRVSPARWGSRASAVRPLAESGETVVSIVVAWELCWYRYEVDLGDEAAGAQRGRAGHGAERTPDGRSERARRRAGALRRIERGSLIRRR